MKVIEYFKYSAVCVIVSITYDVRNVQLLPAQSFKLTMPLVLYGPWSTSTILVLRCPCFAQLCQEFVQSGLFPSVLTKLCHKSPWSVAFNQVQILKICSVFLSENRFRGFSLNFQMYKKINCCFQFTPKIDTVRL